MSDILDPSAATGGSTRLEKVVLMEAPLRTAAESSTPMSVAQPNGATTESEQSASTSSTSVPPVRQANVDQQKDLPDIAKLDINAETTNTSKNAAVSPVSETTRPSANVPQAFEGRDYAVKSPESFPSQSSTTTTTTTSRPVGSSSPSGSNPTRPPANSTSPSLRPASTTGMPARPPGGGIMGPGAMRNRGNMPISQQPTKLPPSLQAKFEALQKRNASAGGSASPTSQDPMSMSALMARQAAGASRPAPQPPQLPGSGPGPLPGAAGGGIAARRAGAPRLAPGGLSGGTPSVTGIANQPTRGPPGAGGLASRRPGAGLSLASMGGGPGPGSETSGTSGSFNSFSGVIDPSGRLNFNNKAILTSEGVDFSTGQSFKINMNEMVIEEELGKGNYGTVQRVFHKPTKVTMAMKEIRLELDQSKLNGILMELDILHRGVAPEIVEFYGAFLIESCVYYCMEFMDAGSLDKLYGDGLPEPVLARVTKSVVKGLGFLKDSLQIMHRDVKPTNILVNKKGEVKLCDFGVSGQLERSLAKTNIGCQSYMAPERIKGGGTDDINTYTVASDVWSVGLSIIEAAKGLYPYPPETYSNVFAQLQSIVYGPAPTLPEGYSANAQDFVAQCLHKQPELRPTYGQLLKHPWMMEDEARDVDMVAWVDGALEARAARRRTGVSSAAAENGGGANVANGA